MTQFLLNYIDMLKEAEASSYLSSVEEDFLSGLRGKFDLHCNATYISQKQIDWLEKIVERR